MHDWVRHTRDRRYVGENRCWPCTALNCFIVAIVGVGVGIASIPAALAVGGTGALAVWWRGYLLPYTPQFAPKLASYLPGNPFDPPPMEPGEVAAGETDVDDERVLAELVQTNVIDVDDQGVSMTDEFREDWHERMRALRGRSAEELRSAVLDVAPSATEADVVEHGDRTYVVLSGDRGGPGDESWVRRPNAIAETAAIEALRSAGVGSEVREVAPDALKMFLNACPACGSDVATTLAGSCCGAPLTNADGEVKEALVCESCDVHLHVFEP